MKIGAGYDEKMTHFGFLNINKPAGVTSRWVVDQVQRLVRPDKVGHAGTLDPLATGVLVVAVGPATRLIEYVQRSTKRYRGKFLLGRSSDTEDTDGRVIELENPPIPSLEQLQTAAQAMVGEIQQRPPAYSAIKVEGQRSYDLARAGNAVELPPRPIRVHRLKIVEYEYPELVLDVICGGGTYVRTLGRDLAENCGTSAVMSELTRNAVGEFHRKSAIEVADLDRNSVGELMISPLAALTELPRLTIDAEEVQRLSHGLPIKSRQEVSSGEAVTVDANGGLVAIVIATEQGLRPNRSFIRGEKIIQSPGPQ